MMNALINVLARWKGRKFIENKLESNGYHLHKYWQNRVFSLYGNIEESERYWDEQSCESVRSAGRVDSNARKGFVDGGYRSDFIDELVQRNKNSGSSSTNLNPVNSLAEYNLRKYSDRAFAKEEIIYLRQKKLIEMKKHPTEIKNWNGNKRDIFPYMEEFGRLAGFSWKSRRLVRHFSGDLICEIRPDFGHNPLISNVLPIFIRIFKKGENNFFWDIARSSQIIPGFSYYSYGETPEELVYGLKAHIDLANAIQDAF